MKKYLEDIHTNLQYYANWPPQNDLELGHIGKMQGKKFTYIDNLKNLGLDFKPDNGKKRDDDAFTYMSKGNVNIGTKLSGKVSPIQTILGKLDAGIIVEFTRKNSILFQLKGVRVYKIENQIQLGQAIEKLYKDKKWDRSWVVITELVKTYAATICISDLKDAKLEIKANADISAEELEITNANAEFSIESSKGVDTKIIAQSEIEPLYLIKGIRKWSEKFDDRAKDHLIISDQGDKEAFGEIDFESLTW